MQQLNGKLTQSKWADHLRGCAEVANDIARILNIHEDGARQAMFATVAIDAKNHGVFVEPTPRDSKTPVIQPETVAAESEPTSKKGVDRDEAAAAKADEQIKDVPKTVTPEQAESGKKVALLEGVEKFVNTLNEEGHKPEITTSGLNAYIKKEFDGKTLGKLDSDELEALTKKLHDKLEALRAKKKPATSNDTLEDWP